MSRYNTGNPIDSNNAKDLDDNAKNVDQFTNSEQDTWVDRFGKTRATIAGIQNNALSKSKVSAEVSLASDQRVVTIAGFNASLSTYYIDGIRLSYPSHYTYADITTETITLDESAPSGSIIIATALDPTGTGVVASVDQLASLSAAELSSGLIEGQEYSIVDVGARVIVYPAGTPTLVGDIVNASGQVLQLQPLPDGSWSVEHFIPSDATGDLNQYFSNASSRASGNSTVVTVTNTRAYQLDPNVAFSPAATWQIDGAITFDGLGTVAPNNLPDYGVFTGKVIQKLSSGRAVTLYIGDGSRTYQKVSGRNGAPAAVSAASTNGQASVSGVTVTSMNDGLTPDQGGIGVSSKVVNDNEAVGQSAWGGYDEAIHHSANSSGNTYGRETNVSCAAGTVYKSVKPYTTLDLAQKNITGHVVSIGLGAYPGDVSAFSIWTRATGSTRAERGLVVKLNTIIEGAYLAEAIAMPSNYGYSWYDSGNNLGAFIKYVDDAGENELRAGVFDSTHTSVKTLKVRFGSITYGAGTSDIGKTDERFKSIYLVNSPDVSSDQTKKSLRDTDGQLTAAEKQAALAIARLPKMFKWIAEQEEKSGTDKTVYLHCSPMAQSVWAAMESNNLDPTKYGFISNENGAWSIKPQELLWMICAAQQDKIDSFESRLAALEV